MSWEYVRLKDIATIIMGQSPKSEYFNSEGEGMPFMQGKTEFGEFSPSIVKYTTKTTRVAKNNSILFTVRAPVGALNIANQDICIGRGLASIDSNDGDNYFLYYLIKNHHSLFLSESGEGVYDSINKTNLNNVKLFIPSNIDLRKKIGAILGAYGDLIENNLKRIKLLEQAAQNIYKEWFVNLRFPGYENTPINEETGLPLGWEEVLVNSKALYFGRGVTPKYKEGSGFFGINQKVNKGSILETQHMKEFDPELNIPEKQYAHFGDVLINSLGEGTIGRVHFYSGKSIIHPVDQHMSIFRSEDLGLNLFIYLFFSSYEGQGLLASIKRGSTNMTMLNIGDLRKLEIKIPNRKTLVKLQDIVLPFFKNKNVFLNQNQKLKAARDILLPRLMNRTIEV
jgi:type I restriction enzyme, S subunit